MKPVREEYRPFADRLQKALEDKNMKPVDLAKRIGTSEGMISLYLSARSKPESVRMEIIAHALSVSPVWLMGANVNKNGSATVSKNEDARWLLEQLEASAPEDIALVRRLFEAIKTGGVR